MAKLRGSIGILRARGRAGSRRRPVVGVDLGHHHMRRDQRAAVGERGGVARQLERAHAHVALPDPQVDGVARPPAGRVRAVVVRRVGDQARVLVRGCRPAPAVRSRSGAPSRPHMSKSIRMPSGWASFVNVSFISRKKNVFARNANGVAHSDLTVGATVAAVEPPEHVAAVARQLGLGRDHALLERDGGHEGLPRRAGRQQRGLRRAVKVGLLGVAVQEVDLLLGKAVLVDVEVVVGAPRPSR